MSANLKLSSARSWQSIKVLAHPDVHYTMAVRANNGYVADAIAAIDPDAWVEIDYGAMPVPTG